MTRINVAFGLTHGDYNEERFGAAIRAVRSREVLPNIQHIGRVGLRPKKIGESVSDTCLCGGRYPLP